MDQRHVDFFVAPLDFTHGFLYLGIFACVAHLFDSFTDALGRMTLLFGKVLILFDNFRDLLKVGPDLWFGTGCFNPITRGLGMT